MKNLILFLVLLASSSFAVTKYYLDVAYTGGTKNGAAATPWTSLSNSGATSAINAAIASDTCYVYFAARTAYADTAEVYGGGVDFTSWKTPSTGHPIVFIGNAKYNTNEASPSWSIYTGAMRHNIRYFQSQNDAHTYYNDVVIRGFKIAQNAGDGKAVSIDGCRWRVTNCEVTANPGSYTGDDGPMINLIPTADSPHQGSSAYALPCTTIMIDSNIIHDSYGEAIYLGGGGCSQADPTGITYCQGFPAHDHVTIKNNHIYHAGSRGAQGDGIDIKGGLTNLLVTGNEIDSIQPNQGNRGITSEGTATGLVQNNIIENNFIHDLNSVDDAGLALNNGWGTPNGVTLRNNLIVHIYGGSKDGIKIYDAQSSGVFVYNNDIYNAAAYGIETEAGTVTYKNNLIFGCNGSGNQVTFSGTVTSDYNAYPTGKWGYGSEGAHSIAMTSGQVTACVTNAAGYNFNLTSSSVARNAGATIVGFS